VLQPLFNEKKLRVVNAARGGRSSRTFVSEGHWEKMLAEVKAGDFVIIQFGHNDSGALNQEPPGSTRPLRARGTIPGIGNESEEIDNVITGKHETVYSFGWYLRKMIADTRAQGATPILLTITRTNNWRDGRSNARRTRIGSGPGRRRSTRRWRSSISRASSRTVTSAKARMR
jgi:lysophospholipase L1-like esterase